MIIKRTKEEHGNLLPSIFNLINSIPEEQIFNQDYFLRHPKLIVNRSLRRVLNAFDALLSLVIEVEKENAKKESLGEYNFDYLSKAIMELMESMNSFIEDCQHIFKSTTPPTQATNKIKENFVGKWLKKAKHPTQKSFFNLIKEYKEEISIYINNYKHEHGRIDIIPGHYNENMTLGYIMKNIGETPSGNIEILDLNKIKTIRLDVMYHFFQLYNISKIFTIELLKAQKTYHGVDFKIKRIDTDLFNVNEVLKKMIYKKLLIFPNNDLFKPKVNIISTSSSLTLKYPFGITEYNSKHIKNIKIKNKPYPEYSLLAIPTDSTVKILESFLNGKRENGDKLELSLDDSECFLKIFLTNKKYMQSHTFFKLNYDNLFTIKSSTNIRMPIKFDSAIDSNMYIKIFNIDYLGIKMEKKD